MDVKLGEILERMAELWPDEMELVGYVHAKCSSPRAIQAVGALAGEMEAQSELRVDLIQADLLSVTDIEAIETSTVPTPDPDLRACELCGTMFKPKRNKSRFCSITCTNKDCYRKAKERKDSGPAVIFDQDRETQRLIHGVQGGRMTLKGRKL
jgi:hypothetical protein